MSILIFIGIISWLVVEGSKPEVLPIGSDLPDISFQNTYGEISKLVRNKNKTLIVFFSKDCPHCEYELNVLNENVEKLSGVKIYLFTIDEDYLESEEVKKYKSLMNAPNVDFGVINKKEYKMKLGSTVTPTLYFFNKKKVLTAKIKGETKFERILQELL